MRTRRSPETATDSSDPQVGISSITTQNPWHQSLDASHYFLHVKTEMRFVILFLQENPCLAKRDTFHEGGPILFFFFKKRRLKILAAFWFSELEDAGNIWCLCR
jgi:hypothetical protein